MKLVFKLANSLEHNGVIHPNPDNWWPMGNIGNFIAIDPGLTGTGYAVFSRETFGKLEPPIESGVVDDDGSKVEIPWWARAYRLSQIVQLHCQRHAVFSMYIELPQFMEGGKGMVTARGGDLIKLTTIYGMIAGQFAYETAAPVPINLWKGQTPKDIMERRIMKRLAPFGWQPRTKTTHEMDAVGIGLYVKGHL